MINSRSKITITSIIAPLIIAYITYEPSTGFTLQNSRAVVFLFIVVSAISVVMKTIRTLKSKFRNEPYNLSIFIRPIIALSAGIIGVYHLQSIENKAIAYLYQKANIILSSCLTNNKCPDLPEGWERSANNNSLSSTTYYIGNTAYYLRYQSNNDKNDFVIFINYGLGSRYCLSGGVNVKKLEQWRTH